MDTLASPERKDHELTDKQIKKWASYFLGKDMTSALDSLVRKGELLMAPSSDAFNICPCADTKTPKVKKTKNTTPAIVMTATAATSYLIRRFSAATQLAIAIAPATTTPITLIKLPIPSTNLAT